MFSEKFNIYLNVDIEIKQIRGFMVITLMGLKLKIKFTHLLISRKLVVLTSGKNRNNQLTRLHGYTQFHCQLDQLQKNLPD